MRDARAYKGGCASLWARVRVSSVLRVLSLAALLLLLSLSLRLSPGGHMRWLYAAVALALLFATQQATTGCKNCVVLGKAEKAMFRAHSEACLPESQVDPKLVEAMLNGELVEATHLKRHVYCVLLKCKIIAKDGKLQKNAVLGKMSARPDAKNATKVLESCANQIGDTPEDIAWNLFRCGFDRKAMLFEYMPTDSASATHLDNNS